MISEHDQAAVLAASCQEWIWCVVVRGRRPSGVPGFRGLSESEAMTKAELHQLAGRVMRFEGDEDFLAALDEGTKPLYSGA